MFKINNIIALLISLCMCFLVSCTGDPAQEVEQQIYNTTFHSDQSTQSTSEITTNETTIIEIETTVKNFDSTHKATKRTDKIKSTKRKPVVIVGGNKGKGTVVATKVTIVNATELTTEEIVTTTLPAEPTTLVPLGDDEMCYVTASGEKYHRQGCRYLNKSCIEIIVREAKEKEYTPCKVCKP